MYEAGKAAYERVPTGFWGDLKEQYEKYNPDYAGVYKG